jgi:hypothetical protein
LFTYEGEGNPAFDGTLLVNLSPTDNADLLDANNLNLKYSPFLVLAKVKAEFLPSFSNSFAAALLVSAWDPS